MSISLVVNEGSAEGRHRCLNGQYVSLDTIACWHDIKKRISDAVHQRDGSDSRTDSRIYYNGILRVLRRKLRSVEKQLKTKGIVLPENRNRWAKYNSDFRLLELSGV